VFEALNVANMVKNHSLAKSISDAAWSQLVRYATYKAEWAGRSLVLVDPKYTSQECSGCSERVPKDLSVRVHDCPHCGLVLDRDLNAARNILARGLASIGINP
jgi:putative transposase